MVGLHFICAQSWRAGIEIFITVCRLHLGFYILIVEHTMMSRLTYFANMITSLAWFGAGHGTIYQTDLPTMDVEMRRLLRVVGPPPSAWPSSDDVVRYSVWFLSKSLADWLQHPEENGWTNELHHFSSFCNPSTASIYHVVL